MAKPVLTTRIEKTITWKLTPEEASSILCSHLNINLADAKVDFDAGCDFLRGITITKTTVETEEV